MKKPTVTRTTAWKGINPLGNGNPGCCREPPVPEWCWLWTFTWFCSAGKARQRLFLSAGEQQSRFFLSPPLPSKSRRKQVMLGKERCHPEGHFPQTVRQPLAGLASKPRLHSRPDGPAGDGAGLWGMGDGRCGYGTCE